MKRIYDPSTEEQVKALPKFDTSDATLVRKQVQAFHEAAMAAGVQRPTDSNIEEIERLIPGPDGAPDIPIRIYMPKDRTDAGPGFVNFHGGGFVMGDLESEHKRCLSMTAEGGAVSIGVAYRLAPENPFPAGVEDCYAAVQWVSDHAEELNIDPNRLAIGGGSAGGNLAAAVALMARDRNGLKIALQMLFYPVIDNLCQTPSMVGGEDLYVWDYQNSLDMWNHYLGEDRSNVSAYASPARADSFADLPPAYIMTAEHDPLRDEGINYAMSLISAGVPVELHNYPGLVHAFDLLTKTDAADRALSEAALVLKRALG